jgi:hypothetical protein
VAESQMMSCSDAHVASFGTCHYQLVNSSIGRLVDELTIR